MAKWNRRQKYNVEKKVPEEKSKFKFSKLARRQALISAFSVAAVFVVILGSTYAIFSSVNKSKDYNTLNVGTLEITYDDTSSGLGNIINLNGAYPVSDSDGLAQSPYTFRVKNNGSLDASYKISIVDDTNMISADGCSSNLLNKANIKVSIDGGAPFLLSSKASGSYVIGQGILSAGKSKNHQIRMWIDINSGNEVLGKHYHGKILIQSSSDVLPTDESCFEFDSSTGTITKFICGPYIRTSSGDIQNPDSANLVRDVIIPQTIGGVEIKKIGERAFYRTKITSIVIPEGVTTIGPSAFESNQLTNVHLPSTLEIIDTTAFTVNKLSTIRVPNKVARIGDYAFGSNPLSLIINETEKSFDWSQVVYYETGTAFATGILTHSSGNVLITNGTPTDESCFTFSDGTITAYSDTCSKDVVIPETIGGVKVTSLGQHAFARKSLVSVVIPEGVTTLVGGTFYQNSLTSIYIPTTMTSIGPSSFEANQLKKIWIPSNVQTIGTFAFLMNSLTSVRIQGKSASSEFTSYPSSSPFGWTSGYSDSNITWNE